MACNVNLLVIVSQHSAMKRLLFVPLISWLATVHLLAADPIPADELFRKSFERIAAIFSPESAEALELRTTLEVVRAEGIPKELHHARVDLAIAAPDRLRIGTIVDKERIEFGRNGQELWVSRPGKHFAVRGIAGIPRFASDPSSTDQTELTPLGLKMDPVLMARLPKLFSADDVGRQSVEGESCRVLRLLPLPEARQVLGIPEFTVTIVVRERDSLPVRIAYQSSATDVEIALHQLKVGAPAQDEFQWRLPEGADVHVETVAVSHLSKLFSAGFAILDSKSELLGPARGERLLVATHGAGRLEDHDGTKVLFLKGTPEEIGEQHGTLLKSEVRDLVKRVLYGVGVGSSFAKGRWFFGEIEQCVARLSPFIDPRTLREMDALALAADLESAEIRLANFFPEMFHCSGFALLGSATEGRRIYHGRILDYMKGIGLELNAVVSVVQPNDGHAWVNIGYAGFTGSVTAMNDQHISIGEMGGRGEGNWDGKPMAQLVREVMEKASTLEEAVQIMRKGPRTCEYYYVIADGRSHKAVGIKATREIFEVVGPGEAHPQLETPIKDTVLLSAGDRYRELVRRTEEGFGMFNAERALELMTSPVCMSSNIHSVLFAPDTLDFWVANSNGDIPAAHTRYTKYNLAELIHGTPAAERAD
jgi:isopenicillin-N N-acyltransferase-like protein